MAVTVIVTGQRLQGFGRLGQMTDFLEPAPPSSWLAEAKHRAGCLAAWMIDKDKTAAPRG